MTNYAQLLSQHAVQLQRVGTGLVNGPISDGLSEALKAAKAALEAGGDITSYVALSRAVSLVESAVKSPTEAAWRDVTKELEQLADYEANWAAKLFTTPEAAMVAPASSIVLSYVDKSLMTLAGGQRVDSGLWSDYVSSMEQSTAMAYSGAVKAGYANGESISQIAARFKTISEGLLRREAEALARTGVQHYAQAATEAMYQANKDVIKKMIYFATLDNRTTLLCAGRDGSEWDIDDPRRPPLPAHWGCRSRYIPETRGMTGLEGTRTATGGNDGEEAADEFAKRESNLQKRRDNPNITGETSSKVRYRGRKDAKIFDVSKVKATTEYESFFLDQPSWWQDSVFGPTRAKLVRSGGMKISQFNDMTGRQLTLKELRELDAEAFRRAGL